MLLLVSAGNKWKNLLKNSVSYATVISAYDEVLGWSSFCCRENRSAKYYSMD